MTCRIDSMLVLCRGIRTSCQVPPIDLRTIITRRWKGTASDDILSEGKPTRKHKIWTAEDERKLLELRASGLIARDIAQRLDRDIAPVRWRFKLLRKGNGIDKTLTAWAQEICPRHKSHKAVSKEEIDRVKALRDQEYSVKHIADKLDTPSQRVAYILRYDRHFDRNTSTQRIRWTAEEDALLAELQQKGHSWADISARFPHRSRHSLANRWTTICDRYPFWHERSHVPPSLRKRIPWKPAEVEQLISLYEQDVPIPTIIISLVGRTAHAVRSQICILRENGQVGRRRRSKNIERTT